MKVFVYSIRAYDRPFLDEANAGRHELHFSDVSLHEHTATLAKGYEAVCGFVDDTFNASVIHALAAGGTKLILLRATGYNNVDIKAAQEAGIKVMRVGAYSPYAVAEFAVCLILALNRKIHRAYNKVREGNFLLNGLLGFDLHGKTIGIIGTGKIGRVFARIMLGFGCRVLAYDVKPHEEITALNIPYLSLPDVLKDADIISLHLPLTPETKHMMSAEKFAMMKQGAMLINTSRGGLVDTKALIGALKKGKLGAVGLDVYEEEANMFFQDMSDRIVTDDVFMRLLTFPNVLVTGHQAFFTREALTDIARATIQNMDDFAAARTNANTL